MKNTKSGIATLYPVSSVELFSWEKYEIFKVLFPF